MTFKHGDIAVIIRDPQDEYNVGRLVKVVAHRHFPPDSVECISLGTISARHEGKRSIFGPESVVAVHKSLLFPINYTKARLDSFPNERRTD